MTLMKHNDMKEECSYNQFFPCLPPGSTLLPQAPKAGVLTTELLHFIWATSWQNQHQRTIDSVSLTWVLRIIMLKSVVIEEKKFKHSSRVGADNQLGPNFLC